jgi:hypothetical protein
MKTVLIVYHERLGDICRCLPIAECFTGQGWKVFFECKSEYHHLFDCVDYAEPLTIGHGIECDRVIDLQIWPHRFSEFTASGKNWSDYVFEQVPECTSRQIRLEINSYLAPSWLGHSCLVFPSGYSQRNPPNPAGVILHAHRLFPGVPVCVIGKADLGCRELSSIPQLVAWIAAAGSVLTVNTAASIIASAVRSSWHHIPDLDPQHDFTHPNQIRVGRLA